MINGLIEIDGKRDDRKRFNAYLENRAMAIQKHYVYVYMLSRLQSAESSYIYRFDYKMVLLTLNTISVLTNHDGKV